MDKPNVVKLLTEISDDICEHYCKYQDKAKAETKSDREYDDYLAEYCKKCPLNRLT